MKARNALLILLTSTIGFNAYAITDASKIGANTGAMSYCYDHIASSKDKSKYRLLKLKTLEEYQDLDSGDRARALVIKKKSVSLCTCIISSNSGLELPFHDR
ncbi:hypothetical protein [Vibrio campbellii]|uniref:hypothetical protein n=1 Tax=Vibrio campbellii TaxID=680 RepID=UPI0021582A3C|nr:hypothetical protein [Vibrio campbellii]